MNKDVKLSLCLILFMLLIFMPVYQSRALKIGADYRDVKFYLNHQVVQVILKSNGVAVVRYNISLIISYGSLLGISIKIPEPRIFKEDESPAIKKSEPQQLSSLGGEFEPVLIETTENLNKDLNEIRKELAEVFKNRNLLEPFDRIAIACKQVHAKNIGENRNA